MRHTDYRTLVDRGRKAGLKTADIYNALTSRRPEAGDRFVGETDQKGQVAEPIDPPRDASRELVQRLHGGGLENGARCTGGRIAAKGVGAFCRICDGCGGGDDGAPGGSGGLDSAG